MHGNIVIIVPQSIIIIYDGGCTCTHVGSDYEILEQERS